MSLAALKVIKVISEIPQQLPGIKYSELSTENLHWAGDHELPIPVLDLPHIMISAVYGKHGDKITSTMPYSPASAILINPDLIHNSPIQIVYTRFWRLQKLENSIHWS